MIVYIRDTVREMKNLLGNKNIFRIGLLLEKGSLFQNLPVISYIASWSNHNFSLKKNLRFDKARIFARN